MMVRSFVAVPLPEKMQSDVFAAAQALSRELPAVKWSRKPGNLHVTVKFLGDVAEERLPELGEALEQALAARPRFEVEVRGLGAFPSRQKASVVWAGIDDAGQGLAAVAQAVEAVAARFGVAKEERPFRGHVTVGRSKQGVDARAALDAWTDHLFGRVTVDEVHLYESQLGGDGSTYVLRSRATLARN
jgi:2'-5' RNA ligase